MVVGMVWSFISTRLWWGISASAAGVFGVYSTLRIGTTFPRELRLAAIKLNIASVP